MSAGGELKEEHEVNEIVAGEVVSVRTNKGSFSTKRLVLTAGPWTNKLLQMLSLQLPLKVFMSLVHSNVCEVAPDARFVFVWSSFSSPSVGLGIAH